MASTSEVLSRDRVALWFSQPSDLRDYAQTVRTAWRTVAGAVPWDDLQDGRWPLVPVFHGNSNECPFPDPTAAPPGPAALVFGLPDAEVASWVAHALREVELPVTVLGVAVPGPDECRRLPVKEFITHRTVISLGGWHASTEEILVEENLEVVTLRGDDERLLLEWIHDDFDLLGPRLLHIIGRSLRRWIREPRKNEPPERFVTHGLELLWAGAPALAGVVGGLALERELRGRLRMDEDGEKARAKMLGTMIQQAKAEGRVSDEAAAVMFRFADVRTSCAHAVGKAEDADVAQEVAEFLRWFRAFLTGDQGGEALSE